MELTLRQLQVLHAIVVSGSISKAKRSLGLSQPTISQQLAKLEELLDGQLIHRTRGNEVKLTQAGEIWFRAAQNVLEVLNKAQAQHRNSSKRGNLELRFGTTPSLRGRFMEKAATLSGEIPEFSKFEFIWALSSNELVELIASHKLNCAVLSAAAVESYRAKLHVVHLFSDKIVLVVPHSVSSQELAKALAGELTDPSRHVPLANYVSVGPSVPWYEQCENWYRTQLPQAVPYFGCMTHQAAVDIVAAGLATCHAPMSLLPNLPQSVRKRIKIYDLGEHAREAVLVMPKHLLTLRPFVEFQRRLSEWVRAEYSDDHVESQIQELPRLSGVKARAI